MSEDSFSINIGEIKEGLNKAVNFLKNKKVQNVIVILLLLSIIFVGVSIRTQNLDLLIDQTTEEHIPLALDPFYFLRVTEIIAEQGSLPEYDEMRAHPTVKTGWTNEIWPYYTPTIHKIAKVFDPDITLRFTAIIIPVIFFVLGIVAFFFLVFFLTGSRVAGISASAFLTVLPPFLFRSMSGFYDHEITGMFAFFITLIAFTFALRFFDKAGSSDKNNIYKSISFGVLVGFLTIFTMANWGGIANFVFMIIPLSFLLFWLIKVKNLEENQKNITIYLSFYITFFISSIIFGLLFGFDLSKVIGTITLNSSSMLNGLVLLFIISDFIMIRYGRMITPLKEKIKERRILFSSGLVIAIGVILLSIIKGNIFSFIGNIFESILRPFGTGRIGLTVAENRQPFLDEWISQMGDIFYWLFVGGLVALGTMISKAVKEKNNRYLFVLFWILLLTGILYSRVSSGSLLDGNSFMSKLFYFGSVALFAWFSIKLYKDPNEDLKIRPELLIIFSWMIFMLIGARGAIRLFFVITPFTCLSAGILISSLGNAYMKKPKNTDSSEGNLSKIFISILFIVVIIASVLSLSNLASTSSAQASQTAPSANVQWQKSMEWVRENTSENSIFAHWWDYGYWVQYLGERPTIMDGGYRGDGLAHLTGRYLLTEKKPEVALSLMKTYNVSHLLIDPTDMGKYPAYSKIGSNNEWDRFSTVSATSVDSSQTQTQGNITTRVYPSGRGVEDDIVYEDENGKKTFLPGAAFDKEGNPNYRSFFIGSVIETTESGSSVSFRQTKGIFIYNGQRYEIPIRKIYFQGEIIDFGKGIDTTLMIIPSIEQSQDGVQIDNLGATIYLNSRVQDSLFAQLYLMNDPEDRYPTVTLSHVEYDPVVSSLRSQGLTGIGDFVQFRGFRGPIKIWKIDYPEDTLAKEEFLSAPNEFGGYDNLQFTR